MWCYMFFCRFLFDDSCADYKYYEHRLAEEEKGLSQTREPQTSHNGLYFNLDSVVLVGLV